MRGGKCSKAPGWTAEQHVCVQVQLFASVCFCVQRFVFLCVFLCVCVQLCVAPEEGMRGGKCRSPPGLTAEQHVCVHVQLFASVCFCVQRFVFLCAAAYVWEKRRALQQGSWLDGTAA